ncbi:MAG: PilZ domain-containing protein [Polyangiales bacterium]
MTTAVDRLSSILPKGNADAALHRGARRRARRWSLDAEIELVSPGQGSGLAINASVGGLRIALDRGVPLDEVCTLRVRTAPERETIEHARVVWSRAQPDGYVLGLAFVEAPQG